MKKQIKKISKIIAGALGIFFALIALGIGFSIAGNPVSYFLAWQATSKFLKEEHPGTDYKIDSIEHLFPYIGSYRVNVSSPTKQDERFNVFTDSFGKITEDSYETWVTYRYTLKWRLNKEYAELGEKAFETWGITEHDRLSFTLIFSDYEHLGPYDSHPNAVELLDFPLNTSTCTQQICKTNGDIYYLETIAGEPTAEYAAKRLLALKERADKAGFAFYTINYVLRSSDSAYEWLSLGRVYYQDIYEEGMVERVLEYEKAYDEYLKAK